MGTGKKKIIPKVMGEGVEMKEVGQEFSHLGRTWGTEKGKKQLECLSHHSPKRKQGKGMEEGQPPHI
jgi:hypothetical protein